MGGLRHKMSYVDTSTEELAMVLRRIILWGLVAVIVTGGLFAFYNECVLQIGYAMTPMA